MKKLLTTLLFFSSSVVFADVSGWYLGGGLAYATQSASYGDNTYDSQAPAIRLQAGYQFGDWIDAELGWNYVMQSPTGIGSDNQSSTIYDLAILPGFTIPSTPLTVFVRLGIDAMSANMNNSWYNQLASNSRINFEYGAGVKWQIPDTHTMIRGQYISYGSDINNGNSNIDTSANAVLIDAAYIF